MANLKIPRVAAKWGLTDACEELAVSWTTDDSASLRSLATRFNRQVLQSAMKATGMDILDGEVENTYRLLTEESVGSGVRTEARRKLEARGIDIAELESDFVSYQAVRSYLRNHPDVAYERDDDDDGDRVETVDENVSRLRSRTVTVIEEKLSQLDRADQIDIGDFQVLLDIRIFCEDCGTQFSVDELLSREGCDCTRAEPPHEQAKRE
ncbi:hypothetical protein Halar_0328 (plasmid) [halophilic archaeon DL31]|nr:hypothetical protein Halar_0328 [halophilic archaeon DL31]